MCGATLCRARPWRVGMPCPPLEGSGAPAPVRPPPHGTYEVFCGHGANLGTLVPFHCHSNHQLVGFGLLTCAWKGSVAQWSSGILCMQVFATVGDLWLLSGHDGLHRLLRPLARLMGCVLK